MKGASISGWVYFIVVGLGVGLASCLVALGRVWWQLGQLERRARRMAGGDLRQAAVMTERGRAGRVAEAMNEVAGRLQGRLDRLVERQGELEAVLGSMTEGVVAVDLDERVMKINAGGSRILGVGEAWAVGRPIQEVVRNTRLLKIFLAGLTLEEGVRGQVELRGRLTGEPSGEAALTFLQVQGAALRDEGGRRMGALFVLHDLTDLRRLERVRRDFVANASHEIKTPVTAIKAAVETLLDTPEPPDTPEGAAPEEEAPEGTEVGAAGEAGEGYERRFLEMILRQSNRLGAIVEDLLTLARIEQAGEEEGIDLEVGSLGELARSAAEACGMAAGGKRIRVECDCRAEHRVMMHRVLLEQAVVNLIDNAIKYSPEGSVVRVETGVGPEGATVTVTDEGCGIEARHLGRIFERFYRTDSARSRAMGGTGLGLAIVKHVAQCHGGKVTVESQPGQGSRFAMHLPAVGGGEGQAGSVEVAGAGLAEGRGAVN